MSTEALQPQIETARKQLAEKGMKVIKLEGKAAEKYLDKAYSSAWDALKASGSHYYDELRAAYYRR